MDKYLKFSVEDFLQDDFFNQWVRNPDAKSTDIWTRWLDAHPQMSEKVEHAKGIISAFQSNTEGITEDFYIRLKNRIDFTIASDKKKQATRWSREWFQIAAAVAGLLIIGLF